MNPNLNDPDKTMLRQAEEIIEGIPSDERMYLRRLRDMKEEYISDDDQYFSADEGV
jgi:hypothetical protein